MKKVKRPLGRPWFRWENNINTHIMLDSRAWTDVAEGRDKRRAVLMNLRVA